MSLRSNDSKGGTQASGPTLGLPHAIALVMGGIMGTGLFGLPAQVAGYGMLAIVTLVLVTVGAIALALMFGSLVRRIPAPGGPYAYARFYFGDFAGFTSAWPYWITAWAGNAGIVAVWVIYVRALFGWVPGNSAVSVVIALFGLWVPVAINLTGIRNFGVVQVIMTSVTFIPIVILATVGVGMAISRQNFPAFNPSGQNTLDAVSSCAAVMLFSYLGVELAAVAAGKIRNPTRNVPIATVAGTLTCGLGYILCLVAVFGLVPADVLSSPAGEASFSLAFHEIFGIRGAGHVMSLFAVFAGIGALNAWTLVCGVMPKAAAEEGLFPVYFTKLNRAGVPFRGVLISAGLASVVVSFAFLSASGIQVLTTLVLLTGVTAAVPYFLSAASQLYYLFTAGHLVDRRAFAREVPLAILAMVFSWWFIVGAGSAATYYAYLLILLGYLLLLVKFVRKKRLGLVVQGDSSGALQPPDA